MKILPHAPHGVRGTLVLPGDKSVTHRALIFGALATGTTVLTGISLGEDCLTTLAILDNFQIQLQRSLDTVRIIGRPLQAWRPRKTVLNFNNSGTAVRLFMGLLASGAWTLKLLGDASLTQRPMQRVAEPLRQLGAKIMTTEQHLPVVMTGQNLTGTKVVLPIASAQVKSAVILAALHAQGATTIVEKWPTRNHTELLLEQFGGRIKTASDQKTITIWPKTVLQAQELVIPGDLSAAAFWLTAAVIVPHSQLKLKHVGLNPTRSGFLRVLQQMGANLTVQRQTRTGEIVGDLLIQSSQLTAIQLTASQIPSIIDELPLVALLAAYAEGTSTITGAQELHYKETDRIQTVAQELQKLGVKIQTQPDGWLIQGSTDWQWNHEPLDSHGDHRLAMMLSIAVLNLPTGIPLANERSVAISYPQFWQDLNTIIGV
ncbi:3-phosphoshikimate 1-carboxyvinyltransferase [Bombilactobacillus folatiphilus]|uniref:3-phosphoshikimate 1-carboxyvinyltransferase n=1 Tax=Bombilactobacillus folatiphilus TaxID=2923362 RepID=A0ABY4PA32_9LACO|nr:3-phosphoshikimate 1-carboxyvinyltransferase [Bombilactobacillus folatiphilus]UQS82396.1 3-phosphoshikimate 1-carboxyvinyltransferase [Bombilactobacillus folatiphilus]